MICSYRIAKSFFLDNPAPAPFPGWNLAAVQHYLKSELENAGFDLSRKFRTRIEPGRAGQIIFWQGPDDTLPLVVGEN